MKELAILGKGIRMNDNELVSLTDLWKMNGGKISQHPYRWVSLEQTSEFIKQVEKTTGNRVVLQSVRGRSGGTYAHWQIAMAYAKYLSPELHMAVNEVFKQFMDADTALAESVLERTSDQRGIERVANKAIDKTESVDALVFQANRANAKAANKTVNAEISAHGGEGKTYAVVANMNNISTTGMTTSEFRKSKALKPRESTRPYHTLEQMTVSAFQEMAEAAALRKARVFGHDGIVSVVADTLNEVQGLMRRVGMSTSAVAA